MRITKQHYNELKQAISLIPASAVKEHREFIKQEGKAKDIEKRLRWDTLYATRIKIGDGKGMPGLPLYGYLNDSHIDTALKHIMADLEY